ncbi:MAG: hypothetical protein ACLFMO_06670 [Eubacteriales bacterium]
MRKRIYICLMLIFVLLTSCTYDNEVNETDRVIDNEKVFNKTLRSSANEDLSSKDTGETVDDIEPDYTIKSNIYSYKNINVIYPSIVGLEAVDRQNIINKLLREEALSFVDIMEESKDTLNYELDYSVVFQDNNIISIIFKGYRYMEEAPYPVDVFYSINVDLNNGKKLVLGDMVSIDENFVNLYIEYLKKDKGEELKNYACEYLLNSLSSENFTNGFRESDRLYGSSKYVYSYFTGSKIGISWEVPHSVGDHVEVEIPIEVINDLKK